MKEQKYVVRIHMCICIHIHMYIFVRLFVFVACDFAALSNDLEAFTSVLKELSGPPDFVLLVANAKFNAKKLCKMLKRLSPNSHVFIAIALQVYNRRVANVRQTVQFHVLCIRQFDLPFNLGSIYLNKQIDLLR